jgi:hypothetical protein
MGNFQTKDLTFYNDQDYSYIYQSKLPQINILNPVLENYRHKLVSNFMREFMDIMINSGIFARRFTDKNKNIKSEKAFTRWLIIQISLGKATIDPLIPNQLDDDHFDQIQVDMKNWMDIEIEDDVKEELVSKTVEALNIEEKLEMMIKDILKFVEKNKIKTEDFQGVKIYKKDIGPDYILSIDNLKKIKISKHNYGRIKLLYDHQLSFADRVRQMNDDRKFLYYLYILLLRYETLGPGGSRQGAMSQELFNDMNDLIGSFELYAGAINSSSNNYTSLFYDIEKHFGSRGNVFSFKPIRGFYQANPPCDETVVEMSIDFAIRWLNDSEEPLVILILVPPWDDDDVDYQFSSFQGNNKLSKSGLITYGFSGTDRRIMYSQHHQRGQDCPYRSPNIFLMQNEASSKIINMGNPKLKSLVDMILDQNIPLKNQGEVLPGEVKKCPNKIV